jgi:hypothetical protein
MYKFPPVFFLLASPNFHYGAFCAMHWTSLMLIDLAHIDAECSSSVNNSRLFFAGFPEGVLAFSARFRHISLKHNNYYPSAYEVLL